MILSVRVASVRLLDDVSHGGSLNTLYGPMEASVQDSDRAFLKELVYGSLRLWPLYKGIVRQLLDRPLKAKDSALEATLIMAMYELDECHTPDYASVSAAVDVCDAIDKPWASRLINGCLRRYQRDRSALHDALGDTERAALPGWLYKSLIRSLPDAVSAIADVSKKKPPLPRGTSREGTWAQVTSPLRLSFLAYATPTFTRREANGVTSLSLAYRGTKSLVASRGLEKVRQSSR